MSDGERRRDHLRPIAGGTSGRNGNYRTNDTFDWRKYWEEATQKKKNKNGSGSGGSNDSSPDARIVAAIALAVLVAFGIYTSVYTVDISEEAVVTRFGQYHRTSPSGFHMKLPFGIERIYTVQSKRILQEEFGFRTRNVSSPRSSYDKDAFRHESLMLTGDLNVADVEWILQYRISDPWKYLFHAREVTRNIRDVSLSIMRRVVGDRLVGDVLTTGRVEISDQAKILTQEVLNEYDMGITIERIVLQGVNPPDKVKPAFNEVNAAKQVQEQTINNAEREYNRVIPEAHGKAEKVVAEAEAYAINVVNRAKGDANRFEEVVAAYRSAPDLVKQRMYIETLEEIFGRMESVTIVDSKVKGLLPLYSPSGQPGAGAAAARESISSLDASEKGVTR